MRIEELIPKKLLEELNIVRCLGEKAKNLSDLEPLEWDFILENFSSEPDISPLAFVRRPKREIKLGNFSRLDEFCSIRTPLETGKYCHIAAKVILGGGPGHKVVLGNHITIASGSSIYTTADEPKNDPFAIYPYPVYKVVQAGLEGDVIFKNFSGVGLHSVVLPNVHFEEGAFVAPLSQVKSGTRLKAWTIYGGVGTRFKEIGKRKKTLILKKATLAEQECDIMLKIIAILKNRR